MAVISVFIDSSTRIGQHSPGKRPPKDRIQAHAHSTWIRHTCDPRLDLREPKGGSRRSTGSIS